VAVEAPKASARVEILDLLRGIAVLTVLIFHYSFRQAVGDDGLNDIVLPALVPFTKYGFLGVQLFFVISGFVIAYSAEHRTGIEFGIARIARIYPAFIVCMTLTFIVTLAFGAPIFQATFLQWLANYMIVAPALKQPFMDNAYWSLVYELTFYAWIAVFMLTGWFRRQVDVIIIVWMALSMLNQNIVQSAILKHVLLTDQSGFFAAGLTIYELYCGRRDAMIKLMLALSTLVAIGQALHLTDWYRVHNHFAYDDRIVVGISVLAVAAVGLVLRVRRLPIPSHILLAIGGITYPLYLLHQHIGYIVINQLRGAMPPWLVVTATAAAMILLALTIWRGVERRGQRMVKRLLSQFALHLGDAIALQNLRPWRR
jgi:peptidoglycan/LPS O-acetylase OafA/YrhL